MLSTEYLRKKVLQFAKPAAFHGMFQCFCLRRAGVWFSARCTNPETTHSTRTTRKSHFAAQFAKDNFRFESNSRAIIREPFMQSFQCSCLKHAGDGFGARCKNQSQHTEPKQRDDSHFAVQVVEDAGFQFSNFKSAGVWFGAR